MPKLVKPNTTYKQSLLEALKEFKEDGVHARNFMHLEYEELDKNFDSYVQKTLSRSSGENLPEGFVPDTILWLVEGDKFIGETSIRHELNDRLKKIGGHIGYAIRPSERRKGYGNLILKLSLEETKKLGIDKVLITCEPTNIGSKKIIENNGGIFEKEIEFEGEHLLHYWIENI
jgi:predicted acetyltransferase